MAQPAKNLVKNAVGRYVPEQINGEPAIPFKGVGKHKPEGYKHGPKIRSYAEYPSNGDKRVKGLKEALKKVH